MVRLARRPAPAVTFQTQQPRSNASVAASARQKTGKKSSSTKHGGESAKATGPDHPTDIALPKSVTRSTLQLKLTNQVLRDTQARRQVRTPEPEADPYHRLTRLTEKLDQYNVKLRRQYSMGFRSLPVRSMDLSHETEVFVGDEPVNANHLYYEDAYGRRYNTPAATVCAYPKTPEELDRHVKMIKQLRPGIVVILAQDKDVTGEAAGYFKKDGATIHGDLRMSSELKEHMPVSPEYGLDMKLYELTIDDNPGSPANSAGHPGHASPSEEEALKVPVIHLTNLVDGYHLEPEKMDEFIHQICSKMCMDGDDGENRAPLFHCKEGLGRAGQAAAHYMMQDRPDLIRSTESLIHGVRRQRSPAMLYSPGQINALAAKGKALGIPEFVEDQEFALGHVLARLGIDIQAVPIIPDSDPVDFLEALEFNFREFEGTPDEVLARLQKAADQDCAILLEHDFNGSNAQVLWTHPEAELGMIVSRGGAVKATPEAYLVGTQASGNLEHNVRLTTLAPSQGISAAASYCCRHPGEMQSLLLGHVMDDEKVSFGTIAEIGDFLRQHDESAHALDIGIDTMLARTATIRRELGSSSRFMLEFGDTCDPGARLHRLVFRQGLNDEDGACRAIHFASDGSVGYLEFSSFEDIVAMAEGLSRREDGQENTLSILSAEKLMGLQGMGRQ